MPSIRHREVRQLAPAKESSETSALNVSAWRFLFEVIRGFPLAYNVTINTCFNALHPYSASREPRRTCWGLLSQMLAEESPKGSANLYQFRRPAFTGVILKTVLIILIIAKL